MALSKWIGEYSSPSLLLPYYVRKKRGGGIRVALIMGFDRLPSALGATQ